MRPLKYKRDKQGKNLTSKNTPIFATTISSHPSMIPSENGLSGEGSCGLFVLEIKLGSI
jgi:hypothetical protein